MIFISFYWSHSQIFIFHFLFPEDSTESNQSKKIFSFSSCVILNIVQINKWKYLHYDLLFSQFLFVSNAFIRLFLIDQNQIQNNILFQQSLEVQLSRYSIWICVTDILQRSITTISFNSLSNLSSFEFWWIEKIHFHNNWDKQNHSTFVSLRTSSMKMIFKSFSFCWYIAKS